MNSNNKIQDGTLPWTKSCFVCGEDNHHGLQLKSRVENNTVILSYTTKDRDLGWRHLVHGGIAMTLLDEVMTWAAILAARYPCVSAELTVRMKKPIETNCAISAESKIPENPGKIFKTEAVLKTEDGEILATASGKYMRMPGNNISFCSDDFVFTEDSIQPEELMDLA